MVDSDGGAREGEEEEEEGPGEFGEEGHEVVDAGGREIERVVPRGGGGAAHAHDGHGRGGGFAG